MSSDDSGYARIVSDTHSVKQHLDVDAENYDVQIRRFIPYYDEMLATGVEMLASLVAPDAHVVDLGGGTGGLSAEVLRGLPQARVTVLDVDPEMLGEARRRLAGFGDRVSFQGQSFLDPLPSADAFVASIALHHVHDLEQKTDLYRAIRAALAPGGAFLNLDAALTDGPRVGGLMIDGWVAHMVEQGIPEGEARGHIAAWADEDRYFPLDTELAALRQAGFTEVECIWRRNLGSICCGLR
jgi:tRNA (cmo5U34)-methyltransferase